MRAAGARHKRGFATTTALLSVGTLVWSLPVVLPKPAPPVTQPLPVSIAVVVDAEKPVASATWTNAQLAQAERLYGDFGVHFKKTAARVLPARFAHLETRADRDALVGEVHKGVINVFVVASLRDVDDPKLMRQGVHWAAKGDIKRSYVIVASSAQATTMAHEIGHYFGLPHLFVKDNLMGYERSGAGVFLNAKQKSTVVINAVLYVKSKRLVP